MESEFTSEFNTKYSLLTRKMVRLLSYDSRITVSELAEQLHMSRGTATSKLSAIEKRLGMSYTLEFDPVKLGLVNPHVILVRFRRTPDYLDVARVLSQSYVTQFAARTKGSYDLLVYANAYSLPEYLTWDMRMRAQLMKRYKMEWESSTVSFNRMGYFPVKDDAIDRLDIAPKYRKMLKLLNLNSRMPINQIGRILKINYKTAIYAFNTLLKLGYIKRFTVNLAVRDNISLMARFNRFVPTLDYQGVEDVVKDMFTSDDKFPLVNRTLLATNTVGSYDSFDLGAYDNFKAGYAHGVELYNKRLEKYDITKTEYGEVKDILIGKLPIRSIDAAKEFRHFHIPNL
ncbi:MAG TPA: Lrp/AsnC family transcriptional regulator [Candidatus Baltobacteraceae bacterium]|nr:Lrp/AsnC family transcriptional regulator [Candidatus Baltobacteraceae bacterium]